VIRKTLPDLQITGRDPESHQGSPEVIHELLERSGVSGLKPPHDLHLIELLLPHLAFLTR
jgi:hypothetical protein